jgi:hypothetical protein
MDNKIYSTSRRVFIKNMAVGAGAYVIGSLLIHPKKAIGQSVQGYLEKVPMEARWSIAAGGLVNYQVNLAKANFEKEGREKYIENAKKYSQIAGARLKGLADRLGFTGNDAKSAAAIIPAVITVSYGPSQKYEIEEATAEKARVKCIECVFWNTVKAQKITDDLCSPYSHDNWEGCAKAINPKLTSTLVKARPRGDSVCEWVIELKA